MKHAKAKKPYWEMDSEELANATAAFDKPIPLSKTRPLTKQERAEFERMRRMPHQSVYMVRLDPDLVRRSAAYAKEHNLTLTEVINRSLRGMLTMVGQ